MFQPELFEDLPTEQKPKRFQLPSFAGRFLRLKVAYEDLIFLTLAILLMMLGGFCLGVERGKRLVPPTAVLETEGLATAGESVSSPTVPTAKAPSEGLQVRSRPLPLIPVGASPAPVVPANESAGAPGEGMVPYAIQLATYVGEAAAREEVGRLAKRDVKAQVIKQGKYFELRAVGYRSRLEAKEALVGLRKMYRDAFIKRSSSS